MDPKANLAEQVQIASLIIRAVDGDIDMDGDTLADNAQRLSELVLALHEHRHKGGFDPYVCP